MLQPGGSGAIVNHSSELRILYYATLGTAASSPEAAVSRTHQVQISRPLGSLRERRGSATAATARSEVIDPLAAASWRRWRARADLRRSVANGRSGLGKSDCIGNYRTLARGKQGLMRVDAG